jgi:hypothetical protein
MSRPFQDEKMARHSKFIRNMGVQQLVIFCPALWTFSILLEAIVPVARIATMKQRMPAFPKPRRSASAALALRAEIERVKNMSIYERVQLALSLRSLHAWLPAERPPEDSHASAK